LHRDGQEVFHHLGISGFADHAVINRRSVVAVGDDIPPQIAAVLGCAVLTGGGAVVNAGQPVQGDTIVVVGLGGVGMAALITAVSLGLGDVVGVDAVPEKLTRAAELGATAVFSPAEAVASGLKAAIVIEAAGNARAFETAVTLTGIGGRTVTVGLPAPTAEATINPLGITAEARTIIGSYLGSAVPARDIPVYAQLWREGKLPVEALISSTIHLADINEAMDDLADGLAVRQVILFDGLESATTR
jgi:alcohol dehydrogenase